MPIRQATAWLRTRRPWCCILSLVQLPHSCYHGALAGCPGLRCSFCKMGAQCVPSGLAMGGVAKLVEGGCWGLDWTKVGAHEQ